MTTSLQIHSNTDPGYHTSVDSEHWTVMLLNYNENMNPENAVSIWSHPRSDEVIILLKGRAVLCYIEEGKSLQVIEIRPGLLYNVTAGLWHRIFARPNTQFAIVNNRDTNNKDAVNRKFSPAELSRLSSQLPKWLTKTTSGRPFTQQDDFRKSSREFRGIAVAVNMPGLCD